MNKTVFISQPMNGLDEKEIKRIRKKVQCHFSMQGDVIADTLFDFDDEHLEKEGVKSLGLFYLSRSLEEMAYCDIAYFCKGWEKARGCKIEHEAAVAYGLEIIYE